MIFWIAAGALAVIVAAMVVAAAGRPRGDQTPTAAYDLKVYRDQLREVEKDLARGVLTEEEAARTRTEIGRRVLAADKALQAAQTADDASPGFGLVAAGLIAAIVMSVGVYLTIGAPGYGDLPLDRRIAIVEEVRSLRPAQSDAERGVEAAPPAIDQNRADMVAELRTILERRPDDLEGWTLLVGNEAALGNFRAAHLAQSRVIQILGDDVTGRHHIDHAEMMILAAGGYVSPEAEAALERGLAMVPRDGAGRYFLGQMYAQQGRPDLALPVWANLLSESTPDAPWVQSIQLQIADVARIAGVPFDMAAVAPRGPSEAEIQAASELAPEGQMAMIEAMVEGLAARLSTEGGSPQDWAQLITAYGVLGRTNAAQIVHDDAQTVFADIPDALQLIDDAFRAAMAGAGGLDIGGGQ